MLGAYTFTECPWCSTVWIREPPVRAGAELESGREGGKEVEQPASSEAASGWELSLEGTFSKWARRPDPELETRYSK